MQAYIILILLLVLIILAALFQTPSVGKEHFYVWVPQEGTGKWGESPPCNDKSIGFQEDRFNPGRYWGWNQDEQRSCAFYKFSNDILSDWHAKDGNNGTVSCMDFCKSDARGKSINGCIGGWDMTSNQKVDCNTPKGLGANVQCWCQKGEGIPNAKTTLDGNEVNVCNNPANANTRDSMGRMWGYENGASCYVKPS